jgi:hypothetical protein
MQPFAPMAAPGTDWKIPRGRPGARFETFPGVFFRDTASPLLSIFCEFARKRAEER